METLVPAIIQDVTGKVLMLGYMNLEALKLTLKTGNVHLFSRKRKRIWMKGETSGNILKVQKVFLDCDADTLLVKAEKTGPVCHTGKETCFFREVKGIEDKNLKLEETRGQGEPAILVEVANVLKTRKSKIPEGSYSASLFAKGAEAIHSKLREEVEELIEASKQNGDIVWEAADLLFHILVLLTYHGIDISEVFKELERRRTR